MIFAMPQQLRRNLQVAVCMAFLLSPVAKASRIVPVTTALTMVVISGLVLPRPHL